MQKNEHVQTTNDRTTIIQEAVPFAIEELFFSRTDARGIILSGNEVFQRISLYEWEELLGKPHNLIRHPHMPKAVFWLLWDVIKKGQPIGAYVKNRAKDGRYYWVFAIVTPIEDGYLSVRLKPSSELMPAVEALYAEMVVREKEEGLSPEESASELLKALQSHGFADYSAFMAAALSQELQARNQQCGEVDDQQFSHFQELAHSAKNLLHDAQKVIDGYGFNSHAAFNMRIQAAHLHHGGNTIDVISSDYNELSQKICDGMEVFIQSASKVYESINYGLFLLCTAEIQREVVDHFHQEDQLPDSVDKELETELLEQQRSHYESEARASLKEIAWQSDMFVKSCQDMKRLAGSLEVIRIMGKIEIARIKGGESLNELLDGLGVFQQTIIDGLKEIELSNQSISYHTGKLL